MQLFERIRASFRADAHGFVDAMEDRTLLLKQHLRDAESELLRKRNELTDLSERHSRLEAEREKVGRERQRHDSDAELALSEGRDDLARKALARALPLAQLTTRLERGIADTLALIATRSEILAVQEHELVALRLRVEAYLAAQQGALSGEASFHPEPVTEDQVEIELLRRKRARQASTAPADESTGEGR